MISDGGAVPVPVNQPWAFEEWVQRWHTGDHRWD